MCRLGQSHLTVSTPSPMRLLRRRLRLPSARILSPSPRHLRLRHLASSRVEGEGPLRSRKQAPPPLRIGADIGRCVTVDNPNRHGERAARDTQDGELRCLSEQTGSGSAERERNVFHAGKADQ
jgi:hypothetical protein